MQQRKNYTEEFKKQMVSLYNSGKSPTEIIREYKLPNLHCTGGDKG